MAPGCCLGYIGDEILPSFVGITINICKDPNSRGKGNVFISRMLIMFKQSGCSFSPLKSQR